MIDKPDLQALLEATHKLQSEKKFDEALLGYDKILSEQPHNWEVVRMKVGCLGDMKRFEEAYVALRPAISYEPGHPLGHTQCGNILQNLGDHERAGHHYRRALECSPTLREAIWNNALWSIGHGDRRPDRWRQGWADYELAKGMNMRPRHHHTDEWKGEYLGAGKRLYIKWEQGIGDTIMFARFVAWAKQASGAHVIFEVQEPLVELLCNMDVDEVVPWQHGLAFACEFDAHVSLLSLLHLSGASVDSIGKNFDLGMRRVVPPSPSLQEGALEEPIAGRRLKIGVCHKGNPSHANDHNRSIAWETFKAAIDGVDADYYSLTPGEAPEGTIALTGRTFYDTAAVIAGLDLVITVDTSVAHLAGVLGANTWMLTPCNPDFRWFFDREDTPWYPTMRLIRQASYGQWDDAIARVNVALKEAVSHG